MVKTDSKPVSEKELEEESDIEEVIEKDGAGYGDLQSLNAQPDETNRDAETYVGKPAPKESETYIQERKSYSMGMTDQNKLKNTKLGDHINYYENGVAGNGVVSKMSGQFIQIFKEDGQFYNININDTFHVSDILINKTWDAMSLEERTDELMKIKAYSPRFLSKTWDQLPRELKDVMKVTRNQGQFGSDVPDKSKEPKAVTTSGTTFMDANGRPHKTQAEADAIPARKRMNRRTSRDAKAAYNANTNQTIGQRIGLDKSTIEDGALGNTGSSPTTGVSTKIPFDAPKDYEGQTHATKNPDREFQYEDEKPEVGKEKPAPEVKLDEQGLVKGDIDYDFDMVEPDKKVKPKNQDGRLDKAGEFVYSDNPQGYKLPPQPKQKGYGMRYGVKYINEEEDN